MARLDKLSTALARAREVHDRYTADQSVTSVINQLDYMIELEEGKRTDAQRLGEIILGILAIREIEPLDADLADMLCEVAEEGPRMQAEQRRARRNEGRL